jgi:hypothetical protein
MVSGRHQLAAREERRPQRVMSLDQEARIVGCWARARRRVPNPWARSISPRLRRNEKEAPQNREELRGVADPRQSSCARV